MKSAINEMVKILKATDKAEGGTYLLGELIKEARRLALEEAKEKPVNLDNCEAERWREVADRLKPTAEGSLWKEIREAAFRWTKSKYGAQVNGVAHVFLDITDRYHPQPDIVGSLLGDIKFLLGRKCGYQKKIDDVLEIIAEYEGTNDQD